jgi:DNA-directed RNA polymerase specialized sigma24 family protein
VEDADKPRPWWDGAPELDAARNEVLAWLRSAEDMPTLSDEPDPVVMDFFSGASLRELAAARDDLARARARYAEAVRAARAVGLSWGEIGGVLGITKQALYRRFGNDVD